MSTFAALDVSQETTAPNNLVEVLIAARGDPPPSKFSNRDQAPVFPLGSSGRGSELSPRSAVLAPHIGVGWWIGRSGPRSDHCLREVRLEDLTENSVLIGPPAHITDVLKKVEVFGIDEVILYFNVGLKPHELVEDEMAHLWPRWRQRSALLMVILRRPMSLLIGGNFGQNSAG